MKTKDIQNNLQLGVFVVIGIIVFLTGVFFIGRQNNIFSRTFTAFALFKNVEGLNEGDNVWLSGVKIGTVKAVSIYEEGKVIVKLALKANQNKFIAKNATALIGSDGLVGNKIVIIRPGKGTSIQDNDTINSTSPPDTQELFNIAKDVGENTRSLTSDLNLLIDKINKGQGVVGQLLNDEGPIAQDIKQTFDRFKATGVQAAQASKEFSTVMNKINNGDGLVNRLVTDTTLAIVFDETLENIKRVSKNSADMSRNLEELIGKMNNKNNTVGLVLADTAFANKLKVTVDNAKSASAKLDENLEAMKHNFLLRHYFKKKAKSESNSSNE
jgi:phospholipid/cholesterol/gamma-HCH transport system substrate-binding protein